MSIRPELFKAKDTWNDAYHLAVRYQTRFVARKPQEDFTSRPETLCTTKSSLQKQRWLNRQPAFSTALSNDGHPERLITAC